jgi:hypothetical protein
VIAGVYGDDLTVPQITVDVTGVIQNAVNVPIRQAAVGIPGVVRLNDSTTSPNITEALTARAGKFLQDQIGNLSICVVPRRDNVVDALNYLQNELDRIDVENLTWCGYYNAQEGFISFVSAAGVLLGYQLGDELPLPERVNAGNFFIVNVPGNPYVGGDFNAPNDFCFNGDWVLQDIVRWTRVNTGSEVVARNVTFDSRGSCFSANNVQSALQQVCSYLRTPVGGATISETKPTNPYQGQLWWDNEDGYFYIYYRDGNGAQWVEIGGGGSESLAASGGTVYEIRTGVGLTGGPITTEGTIFLDPAQTDTIGGVFIPQNRGLDLLKTGQLTLAPATKDLLGGIKVGSNLTIDPDGTLNATGGGGGGGTADDITIRPIKGLSTASNVQQALQGLQLEAQDRIETAVALDEGLTVTVTAADLNSNQGTQLRLTPIRANTSRVGVVSLTNDLTGNSESLALTQKAGAYLQGEIQALVGVNTLAGTYDAAKGEMIYVTPAGALKGFTPGQNCPPATPSIDNYYVIVTVGGNKTPPGGQGPAGPYDWYIVEADTATNTWFLIDFPTYVVDASSVSLAPIPGLTATNVQDGIAQLQAADAFFTKQITSSVGLDVTYNSSRNCLINMQPATSVNLGGVYVVPNRGLNLGVDGGLTLAPPTSDGLTIGGVKAGRNITIDADGTINSSGGGGGGSKAIDISVSPILGIQQATNVQRALELIELQVQDRVEFAETSTSGVTVKVTDPPSGVYDGSTLTINVDQATTGGRGLVQLTNDITGQSETIAPTQKAISTLNGKVDALTGSNVLAGTYNSATGTMVTTTPAGAARGFLVGKQAPLATAVPDNYYVIVVTGGGFGPVGAQIPPTGVQPGDWFVVEREQDVPAAWITIDFDQAAVAAQNVSVATIPGLAATNSQSAFTEIVADLGQTFTQIGSTVNGISVQNLPVTGLGFGGFGIQSKITLNPATSSDIGGVFVAPNFGLNLVESTGALTLAPATTTVIGGVKIGSGLAITPDGTLSVNSGPGPEPSVTVSIKLIDDISSQFNGVKTQFVLTVSGTQLGASAKTLSLFLDVGGVSQPPLTSFNYADTSSTVTFTSPPPTGASFSGRVFLGVS